MSITPSVSSAELRQFIEKVEHLEEEKKAIQDQIKEIMGEAKAQGFDAKIMRIIIRMRKMKKEDLLQEQEILDIYTHALGMQIASQ